MKKFRISSSFCLALVCLAASVAHAQRVSLDLSKGWEFHEVGSSPHDAQTTAWHPATVPGSVQTDLLASKLIPDPYVADNEDGLQWIGKASWEYRSSFEVSEAQVKRGHAELVFEGLDTLATVYLNDEKILDANNMFRIWRVPVRDRLKPGANRLRIVFESPLTKLEPVVAKLPYHLLGGGTGPLPSEHDTNPTVEPFVRKAPYNFGWDWGPRYMTEGVWRPVRLEFWDGARIADVFVEQADVTATVANTVVHVAVEADQDGAAQIRLTHHLLAESAATPRVEDVVLHKGRNELAFPVRIEHPSLWFPNGYGRQDRYEFATQVVTNGKTEDSSTVRTGLRTIELHRADDQWGRSFEFVVNGIPVFAKGANVIPFDSFPARVKEGDYRKVMEAAREANMNMVRDWGGGYYETDEYYDICDELGILVWQEFMFAGGVYPGDRAFFDNVRAEAIDQVTRLRNHPSIAIFNGNNEAEAGWYGWGGQQDLKKSLKPEDRDQVWGDYLRLFKGLLPEVVAKYDPQAAYWPSSPSNNFEAPEGNTSFGDDHYWAVWHGDAPFSLYDEQYPRFMSEYGYQSFPEMKTVLTFATSADMRIDSPVMLAHQKNHSGNAIIHTALSKYYGEPKDFASFLYASQVQQAEAIKISAEHLRRNRPRVMGSLYWQLNDCWPVASWASLDYYGRWKALHYYAKRFYAPVLVSPHEENGNLAVYVVSDLTQPLADARLHLQLLDFSGKKLWEKEQTLTVAPLTSAVGFQIPLTELLASADKDGVVLRADLIRGNEFIASNDHFFDEIYKHLKLPPAAVQATVTEAGGKKVVRLRAKSFAAAVYLNFGDAEAHAQDNYFNLMAGETREIPIDSTASAADLQKQLKVVSLKDAF